MSTTAPNLHTFITDTPLPADGGMGTQLLAAGLTLNDNAVQWNLTHSDIVAQIHQRYADAGSRLLTTNTFQGSRTALAMHGLDDQAASINEAGAQLARQAADAVIRQGEPCWVAADVGPFGGFLEPLGDTTAEELEQIFTAQFAALHKGGADVAMIETMSDPAEMEVAIRAARGVADWPIIATYAYQRSGDPFTTMMGNTVDETLTRAVDAGATIVGANCGTGLSLSDYIRLAQQMVRVAGETPVIVQPNAGAPVMVEGEATYAATPAQMADTARELIQAGVRIVGGCCGTTPDHLAAVAAAITSN